MYERSAIVLERYLNKRFGFDQKMNLRENYTNYCNIVKEVKEYQEIVLEEEGLIEKFDEVAKQIQNIQSKQAKLYESNLKMEEMRNQLFCDLGERPEILESKLNKVEDKIVENNDELKKLGEEFIKSLTVFSERQKERNKCARKKRVAEANHIGNIKDEKEFFEQIDTKYIKDIKTFLESDLEEVKEELIQIMMKNGKNEKIPFHKEVIQKSITARLEIAKKELECYLIIYERSKKLLTEIENEELKLAKYEKAARDISVKLAFLESEKEYIVGFLDNERLTVINGPKEHKKMMDEACEAFDADMIQIKNLYELVLREVAAKSTKKAYKELYNKTYLRDIEQKEKNFEQELNHIKIRMGTVINSNYWRIEGIKTIYDVFQKEVTEKFEKDLSEYQLEEIQEPDKEDILINMYDEIDDMDYDDETEDDEYDTIFEDDDEDDETDDDNDDDDFFDDDEEDDDEEQEDDDWNDFDNEENDDYDDDDFFEDDDDYEEDELDEEEFAIEESKPAKKENKPKVYKQVRGKKMTSKKKHKKKAKKTTKKKETKKTSKKIDLEEAWEEKDEMPKAIKQLKKDAEKQRKQKTDEIKNTKNKKEQNKKGFSKLFGK